MGRFQPPVVPVLLGAFFLSLYLLTGSSDLRHNGDTLLRYQTTQSIADRGHIWLDHPATLDKRVSRGVGGHYYAFYGPGQATLMIPLYVAGKIVAHRLSLPYGVTTLYAARSLDLILGALLVVVFYFFALSVGFKRNVAALLSLVFGMATVVWPDAQSGLEQTQVNLFLLIASYGVWRFVRGDMEHRGWMIVGGLGVGLAILTRYDAALYLPVLALYPAVMRWKRQQRGQIIGDWLFYAVAVVPCICGVLLWNYARFGSPFLTGLHEATLGEPFLAGLAGLLISPGKGLLWYLPLVFLLPWAVPRFYAKHRSLAILFAVLVMVPLLFYSNVLYWHGDPAWGPRYLYTTVPYLILPLGEILEAWASRPIALRLFAGVLVAGSLLLEISAVSVTQWRFWYRIEAIEQRTAHPFHWGASNYHYYWDIRQSPLIIQPDDVYQVIRLELGADRYRLLAHPGPPTVSNPADLYPVNTFAFWWTDPRHPILGPRTRAGIATLLAATAAASLVLLLVEIGRRERAGPSGLRELDLSTAGASGS